MKKLGLALSGGGFRASLYHLGLVRFLRDAGILPQVTHITSVSGGSILAAHLALHWDLYNGSANDFDAAAAELLDFVRVDVRNRILRRFPLSFLVRWPRWLTGRSTRKLTRSGLLESCYEKYLFGDTSLFQLPERPELHILATNVSEGCLCSFNRNGLWMIRRQPGQASHIERIHAGLATVPMAVTASSAFPSFFPPLELTGTDVGATRGEFGRQAYTDGGVFDNLGVRMFSYLEQSLLKGPDALDGILVSDVGKAISVRGSQRAGGVIRTALRASDILMDRVWQLESEKFEVTSEFVVARIADVVDPTEDPTALHPEIQRQTAYIRTDLDRFSPLEISSLIGHGYCVGRKACRARPDLFGADLPSTAPWDPIPAGPAAARAAQSATQPSGLGRATATATREARALQNSSQRRIWRTLFDFRDWMSYVYVPVLVPILILLPYFLVKSYQRSARQNHLIASLSGGSRDLQIMSGLLEGPVEPWIGEPAEEARGLPAPDFRGLEILQDLRVLDMRDWNPSDSGKRDSDSLVYGYRRVKVFKRPDYVGNNIFRVSVLATAPTTQVRFPPQDVQPKLLKTGTERTIAGEQMVHWEVSLDISKVPAGDAVDLTYEHISPGLFLTRGSDSTSVIIPTQVDSAEVTRWFLLPKGKEYRSFRVLRWVTGKPETVETAKLVAEYLADDSTILAFKLLSVKAGYTHQVTWYYR